MFNWWLVQQLFFYIYSGDARSNKKKRDINEREYIAGKILTMFWLKTVYGNTKKKHRSMHLYM